MRENKGITLIVLIITIIILLILTGITILGLTGTNGLISKVEQAKKIQTESEMQEKLISVIDELQIEKQGKVTLDDITESYLQEKMSEYELKVILDENITEKKIRIKKDNIQKEFTLDEHLNIIKVENVISTPEIELSYKKMDRVGSKINILLKITSKEEISKIEFPDGDILKCNGQKEVAQDVKINCNTEYKLKITTANGDEVEKSIKIDGEENVPNIYVSTEGDDNVGDGTINAPYATVAKAIKEANDGDIIHIGEGIYNLAPMDTSINNEFVSGGSSGVAGVFDQGKELTIYGENEKTILNFDASNRTKRDGYAFCLLNPRTIVRNLTYVYKPLNNKSWSGMVEAAIFGNTFGTVENLFIRTIGTSWASYSYVSMVYSEEGKKYPSDASTIYKNIVNCTIYHDAETVYGSYNGVGYYENIATNILPQQAWHNRINVLEKSFGTSSMSLEDLIKASKEDLEFQEKQVGVYYGCHPWKK